MSGAINHFAGEHKFLSNFFPCEVRYKGETYLSSEAAYQAQKCADEKDRRKFCRLGPAKAKSFGRRVVRRDDFEEKKVTIMVKIVRNKFKQNPDLAKKLVATGDVELIEGNTWGDTFWGVCRGKGKNTLGRILMKVRKELADGTD